MGADELANNREFLTGIVSGRQPQIQQEAENSNTESEASNLAVKTTSQQHRRQGSTGSSSTSGNDGASYQGSSSMSSSRTNPPQTSNRFSSVSSRDSGFLSQESANSLAMNIQNDLPPPPEDWMLESELQPAKKSSLPPPPPPQSNKPKPTPPPTPNKTQALLRQKHNLPMYPPPARKNSTLSTTSSNSSGGMHHPQLQRQRSAPNNQTPPPQSPPQFTKFRTSAYLHEQQKPMSSPNFQHNQQLINHLNNMNVVESGTATIRRRTSTRMPASMMAAQAGQHPFLIRRTPSVHSASSVHLRHNSGSNERDDVFSVVSSGAVSSGITSPTRGGPQNSNSSGV